MPSPFGLDGKGRVGHFIIYEQKSLCGACSLDDSKAEIARIAICCHAEERVEFELMSVEEMSHHGINMEKAPLLPSPLDHHLAPLAGGSTKNKWVAAGAQDLQCLQHGGLSRAVIADEEVDPPQAVKSVLLEAAVVLEFDGGYHLEIPQIAIDGLHRRDRGAARTQTYRRGRDESTNAVWSTGSFIPSRRSKTFGREIDH